MEPQRKPTVRWAVLFFSFSTKGRCCRVTTLHGECGFAAHLVMWGTQWQVVCHLGKAEVGFKSTISLMGMGAGRTGVLVHEGSGSSWR